MVCSLEPKQLPQNSSLEKRQRISSPADRTFCNQLARGLFVNDKGCACSVCVRGRNKPGTCGNVWALGKALSCAWLRYLRDSPGTGAQPPAGISLAPLGRNTEAKLEGAPRNSKLRPCGERSASLLGAWKAELRALANLRPGLAGGARAGRTTCGAGIVQRGGEKV